MSSSVNSPPQPLTGRSAGQSNTGLTLYSWALLVFNVAVILWGAWVRVTGSGAGCGSHWPTCNGQIIPQSSQMETVIEFVHRLTSGAAGLLVLGLVVWAFRAFKRGHAARTGAVLSLGFIVLEGAVGALQVRLGLTADNASIGRAIIQPIHFANTLLLLGALYYTAASSAGTRLNWGQGRATWAWIMGAGLLTLLLGATGAVTALGDTLFPTLPGETLLEGMKKTLDPASNFLLQLRIIHPALALITTVALVGFSAWLNRPHSRTGGSSADISRAGVTRASQILLWTLGAQMFAGILNLMLKAPAFMQLLHLTLACALWVAVLNLFRAALERSLSLSPASSSLREPPGEPLPLSPSQKGAQA